MEEIMADILRGEEGYHVGDGDCRGVALLRGEQISPSFLPALQDLVHPGEGVLLGLALQEEVPSVDRQEPPSAPGPSAEAPVQPHLQCPGSEARLQQGEGDPPPLDAPNRIPPFSPNSANSLNRSHPLEAKFP